VDAKSDRAHTDNEFLIQRCEAMGLIARMAAFWVCDRCKAEWYVDRDRGPRQCPSCKSRRWNDGEVALADLYADSLRIVHLNPYRKPLTVKQKASLLRRKATRRAAAAPRMPTPVL
jgi:hypothetical protein